MPRKPKCQICEKEIDKEVDDWVKNSTGYFHRKCKEERDDLRKHRVISCIVCGKKIDRKTEEHIRLLGGYAHPDCDPTSLAASASTGTVKTVKCLHCGQAIVRDQAARQDGKNFHAACLEEYNDKMALFNYVCNLWGLKAVGPVISHQAKLYRDKGYTYKGMMFTLKYFYEIKKNENKYKGRETIGIIPYVYDEAKQFYAQLTEQRKEIANQVLENQKKEVEVRRIKSPQKQKKEQYDF